MNPNGMNQMGMNFMMMNNNNAMNMDNTTLNIKNIVQPYENKIKELEEIIRQKNFEITVLKQKLNKNNNLMNMNINPINPKIYNQNTNQFMVFENNNQQIEDKGNQMKLTIKSENQEFKIECFSNDKISSICEKYNIKGFLTYNFKLLERNSSISDNKISNYSVIKNVSQIKNVIFKTTNGKIRNLQLTNDCPVGLALIYYMIEYNPLYILFCINYRNNNSFWFDGYKLKIQDETPIEKALNKANPTISVDFGYIENFWLKNKI